MTANVTQTGQAATVSVTVSRGLPGDTGAPGSDATVTQSNVTAAITDAAAFRESIAADPIVKSASFTASNGETYHIVASATVTDPSPVEGKGFTALVRNGTATIGGTAYSSAGTVIVRTFHSGAWANYSYRAYSDGLNTPLDTATGAAAAFALQRLSSTYYGACVKVRRSSDNATQDIGFNSDGTLDTAEILRFVVTGNGFIDTWYDQSGNGRNLTQATNSKQFQIASSGVMVTAGGKPALDCVRANSTQMLTSAFTLAGSSAATMTAVFVPDDTNTSAIIDHGAPFTSGIGINHSQFGAGRLECAFASSAGANRFWAYPTALLTAGELVVVSAVIDPAKTTADERIRIRRNCADVNESHQYNSGTPSADCFISSALAVGSNNASGAYFDGKLLAVTLHPSSLSMAALSALETSAAASIGYSANHVTIPTAWDDSYAPVLVDGYYQSATFAGIQYLTRATRLSINTINTIGSSGKIGVWVDGSYFSTIATNTGFESHTVFLPAGEKTVRISTAISSTGAGGYLDPLISAWPISIAANAPLTKVTKTTDDRIVVYGDSIAVGDGATNPASEGWIALIQKDYAGSIGAEAWGWRSLWDASQIDASLDTLIARFVSWNPSTIWLCIGTNDYGLNRWTAAAFGTAYATMLDKIHTELPDCAIYAQTPILRTTETANGLGSTMGNYRTQIANASNARAWVTLVDGTAFMTTAFLADTVHPSTAGHLLYANAVKTVISIT